MASNNRNLLTKELTKPTRARTDMAKLIGEQTSYNKNGSTEAPHE